MIFPSVFAKGMLSHLSSNVKKILKMKNLKFDRVTRDGTVLVVDAQDPVFASSAITLLTGVDRVAIAERAKKDPAALASAIADVGSRLILSTERFMVKVEGDAKGFVPEDVETAATSAIIEGGRSGVGPGTLQRHDKLIYAFLARSNAYICIFVDECVDGLPYGAHKKTAVCCISDALSAVSCFETLRQGYRIRVAVCYGKRDDLIGLAKMINRIIPSVVSSDMEIDFFKVQSDGRYKSRVKTSLEIAQDLAGELGLNHISLPVSPLIHSAGFVDSCIMDAVRNGFTPVVPLGGMTDDLFKTAREIGLAKYVGKIERLAGPMMGRSRESDDDHPSLAEAVVSRRRIRVQAGPNSIHNMLDSLEAKTQ